MRGICINVEPPSIEAEENVRSKERYPLVAVNKRMIHEH